MTEPMRYGRSPEQWLTVEQVLLDRIRFRTQGALGSAVLDSMELRRYEERVMNQLVFQLQAEVLGNRAGRIVYAFPATPWDHWKSKWLPRLGGMGRWYLGRHPVRESAKAFSAQAIFPEATMVYPKELGPVSFYIQSEEEK